MNYLNMEDMMNTKSDMTVIFENEKHDDNVVIVDGVDWFMFDGNIANKLHISGNSYIGFGKNAGHISVCNRDGALYSLYREEGTLYQLYRFLKIRWEGTSYYSSMTDAYRLQYELFIFDTGSIFLNVIHTPTNNSYMGSSILRTSIDSKTLNIETGKSCMITFDRMNELGDQWNVTYEKINISDPYIRKLLAESNGEYYTLLNGAVTKIDISELNADSFRSYGFDYFEDLNGFASFHDLKFHYWQNDGEIMNMEFVLDAYPHEQQLTTKIYNVEIGNIVAIDSIEIDATGDVLFAISKDEGATYEKYTTEWVPVENDYDGMTAETFIAIGYDDLQYIIDAKRYRIRIILAKDQKLNVLKIKYQNGA